MSKPRAIFEDVSDEPHQRPNFEKEKSGQNKSRRGIIRWLISLFILVVVMIIVGGLTRLTDSGLSITEWKPITGAIPPLNEADWIKEFEKYKKIPEFSLQNSDITLEKFKFIYWWEWGHRQLGRVIGLVWAIGLLAFWGTGHIPSGWMHRFVLLGVLGGAQGAIGWWMVSSGLTGRMVDVASYRLAVHLGLAFIILNVIAWFIWLLYRDQVDLFQARRQGDTRLARFAKILLGLTFAQILLGALVAGIDAGRGYVNWPLMNGQFLPSESFDYTPFWSNFFENPALVQFNHRILGYLLLGFAIFAWIKSRASALMQIRRSFDWVAVLVFGQMVLGIGTVLYAAPWQIAIVHQLGAVIVSVIVLRACFVAMYPDTQRLR